MTTGKTGPSERFNTGGVTRRTLLATGAAVGGAALVGAGTVPAKAGGPKRGGRLRMGISGSSTSDTLDPNLPFSAMAAVVAIGQCRNGLIEVGGNGELIPELAESWEPTSNDATGFRLRLRKGVEFHNGKTLTPADVIASINHHRSEVSKSFLKSLFADITDLKDDGANGVAITLASGNADFPFLLSDPRLQIYPEGAENHDSGIGTGGYTLEEWEPGVRAFSRRNPNYWKADHANFDEVETIAIEDVSSRTSALTTGEVDVINRVERSTAGRLDAVSGLNVVVQNGYKHYTLPMRCDTAPFDNNDLRLAVKYYCPREEILNKILFGYGALGNDHPIGDFNRYIATEQELPQRQYDPDKARHHLRKAGMEGVKIQLNASDVAFEGAIDMAVLYAESARAAGLEIEVVRQPADGYWSNVWMNKPWCISYWSGRPTEDWQFTEGYLSTADYNDAYWKNEKFDRMVLEARAELDEEKRRAMYVEMQRIVSNNGGQVVPVFAADLIAASGKMGHGAVAANWDMDGYRLADRWWFA
ncbi:MAG: ABC transporter substrate-binding protein [Alphaproteobacteria bacterium]